MSNNALGLHVAISAACPIKGVRIESVTDKSTWLIWYAPEATDDQKAAAGAALQAFTPT